MKELAIILATGKLGILTVPLTGGSFAGGGWTPEEWWAVRSPRWSHIGGWVQHVDHIANEVPAGATAEEMLGPRAPECYSSLLLKKPVEGKSSFTIAASFDHLMAPLIVLAPAGSMVPAEGEALEYREHFEIVLCNEGINVWHHEYGNGAPRWHLAAGITMELRPKTIYELEVSTDFSASQPQMIVRCNGMEFRYSEPDLPERYHWGFTGCEGVNRFYSWELRRDENK